MSRAWLIGVILSGLALPAAVATYVETPRQAGEWREIRWPFLRDGWPPGQAYRCERSRCGSDMELYMRPKIGFCNCSTGVADDDEVDRVADLDLISPRFKPLRGGEVIRVNGMAGRERAYELTMPDGSKRMAIGMAVSHRCDLMVAVVQGSGDPAELHDKAVRMLSSPDVTAWMKTAMAGS